MIADILKDQLIGTCKALVIAPLKSLMLDQVSKLNLTGVSAAAIYDGQDEQVLKQIENGDYSLVFASPESVLGTERWRKMFSLDYFRDNCEILVVDEAHCVVHWGTTDDQSQKVPFRKWYGKLLELKSLLSNPRLAVFTATASKTSKRKIFELLQIDAISTAVFEKSPTKENIRFAVKYVSNDLSLTSIFQGLMHEIRARKLSAEKTLIFCRTRKQCSLIFRTSVENEALNRIGVNIEQTTTFP
eukprot:Seg1132.9 transcript_id=Seg1132.9/GoldUCD/mRNA.D3Y31 product="Werner syndrome ATP-dependent helicase" protein_id=Seg1132.9/GoldUCD/D3Y31